MPSDSRFRPPSYENGQDIRDRSFDYACDVVGFCEELTEIGGVGRMMVPQLLECSLTFATMLEEAKSAESDADFISKCCIGLKECRESWTRMRICERRRKGSTVAAKRLVQEGSELIAIVGTIIAKKRASVAAKRAAEKAAKLAEREAKRAARAKHGTNS
jgi:four helix bundle protein